MNKWIILISIWLSGCVSTGDIAYQSLQPSIDKNGNKTFDFYYTKAVEDSYSKAGGKQAMFDFFIPRELAKHDFCNNGYTLLKNTQIEPGYYMQHGQCK